MTARERPVVELIIRGVGGETAEEILGGPVYQVAGDNHAGFFRSYPPSDPVPGEPTREAYEWGRLTSGTADSGLWWLLLPFTLSNVAGWLTRRGALAAATRGLATIGGAVLTALFVTWLGIIVVGTLAVGCGSDTGGYDRGGRLDLEGSLTIAPAKDPTAVAGVVDEKTDPCIDPAVLSALGLRSDHLVALASVGAALAAVVLLGVLWGPRQSQILEEHELRAARRLLSVTRLDAGRYKRNAALDDPDLWYRWKEYRRLWRAHLVVSAAALGAVIAVAIRAIEPDWSAIDPQRWLIVAVLLAVSFAALSKESFRGGADSQPGSDPRRRFPLLANVVAGMIYAAIACVSGGLAWTLGPVVRPSLDWIVTGKADLTLPGEVMQDLSLMLVVLTVTLLLIGVVMFIIRLGEWRASLAFGSVTPGGFRYHGPLVANFLAVTVVAGGFSALNVVVGRLTLGEVGFGRLEFDFPMPEIVVLSILVPALALLIWYRFWPLGGLLTAVEDAYPEDASLSQARQERWRKRVARARRFATVGRGGDLFLTAWALAAFILVGAEFIFADSKFQGPFLSDSLAWLHTVSSGLIVAFLFPGVWVIRRLIGDRSSRRSFGKVWDVLSFWPRRFHPFAAPSYGERAVPEIVARLQKFTGEGSAVILSAHSQGSVLSIAALLHVPEPGAEVEIDADQVAAALPADVEPRVRAALSMSQVRLNTLDRAFDHASSIVHLDRLALVTYGSPLSELYGRFFTDYFGTEGLLNGVLERLGGRWQNFYRRTDYIGKRVFIYPGYLGDGAGGMDDPPGDDNPDKPILEAIQLPDGDPAPTFPFESHSNYAREPLLNEWMALMAVELSDPD